MIETALIVESEEKKFSTKLNETLAYLAQNSKEIIDIKYQCTSFEWVDMPRNTFSALIMYK